jgi:hypothetical protein
MGGENMKGVVEKVAGTGKGLMIGGEWYNTAKPAMIAGVKVGDEVEFKNSGKWIQSTANVLNAGGGGAPSAGGSGGGSRSPQSDLKISKDRCIVRQNAMAHATQIVIKTGVEDPMQAAMMVVDTARILEAYSMGDDDAIVNEELGLLG